MRRLLVDATTAETQADILRLQAQVRDISASATEFLNSIKIASDALQGSEAMVVVEIKACALGLAHLSGSRFDALQKSVDKLITESASTWHEVHELHDRDAQRLTWIVYIGLAVQFALQLVTLAMVLLH